MTTYFDNAATTILDPALQDEFWRLNQEVFANPNSIHSEGKKAKKTIENARDFFAQYLNCQSNEIFFTSGASESNNFFLKSYPCDLVITSPAEHSCVLESAKASKNPIHWLSLDKHARYNFAELEKVISENKDKKILVSIMFANNEIGSINDIQKICELKKKYANLIVHSDCVQALSKIKLDLHKLDIDSISASAHKIHGPKGVGLLYLNKKSQGILSLKNLALIHGGGQEQGFRSGTQNVMGIALFAKAIQIALEKNYSQKVYELDKYFSDKALASEDIVLNNPSFDKIPGIFNLYLKNCKLKKEELVLQLDLNNFCVSSGSACSSLKGDAQIISSYVLRAAGIENTIAEKSIRISLSSFNNTQEIDNLFKIMQKLSANFATL